MGVEGDPTTPLSVMLGALLLVFSYYQISMCSFVPWKVDLGKDSSNMVGLEMGSNPRREKCIGAV